MSAVVLTIGREWGGAVLMSVEHAPADKKTFYGGFTQLGNPAGGLPFTVVLSADGQVVQRKLGETDYDELVRWTQG